MSNMWEDTYREYLRKYGAYEDEERLEEVKQVVSEMSKVMPHVYKVLDKLSRDDMILVDGWVEICRMWTEQVKARGSTIDADKRQTIGNWEIEVVGNELIVRHTSKRREYRFRLDSTGWIDFSNDTWCGTLYYASISVVHKETGTSGRLHFPPIERW